MIIIDMHAPCVIPADDLVAAYMEWWRTLSAKESALLDAVGLLYDRKKGQIVIDAIREGR